MPSLERFVSSHENKSSVTKMENLETVLIEERHFAFCRKMP